MNETSTNFFLILELDPQAPWDSERFARRLREKQNQWSRESTGFTKKAQIAKRHLEQLEEIRRVMESPREREKQASAALTELAEQSQARKEAFQRRLHLAQSKGFLEPGEVDGLINEFKNIYTAQEIQARITVDVRTPVPEMSDEHDLLLESMRLNELNEHLAVVGKKDLYDLLQLPAAASTPDLYAAADRLYGEMLHRQPKNALVSSVTILSGHAKILFQTEQTRRGYDQNLRAQALRLLLKELEDALKHASKKLVYPQQIEDFVSHATQAGWEEVEALLQLRVYARQHGWQLQTSAAPTPTPSEQATLGAETVAASLPLPPLQETPVQAPAPQAQASSTPPPVASAQTQENVPPPEVRDLRSQNTRMGLRLTWLWPQESNEAHLFYSFTDWPRPEQGHNQVLVITRSEYETRGHYLLPAGTHAHYFIVVSLVVRRSGQPVLTPGTRLYVPLAGKRELTYEIKNPRLGYKQRTLHIHSDQPGWLPTLLLVVKQGGLPFHKSEGRVLHREQGPLNTLRDYIITLPDTRFPTHTFGKLFLEDDDLYAVVVIHHPHEKHLRLG